MAQLNQSLEETLQSKHYAGDDNCVYPNTKSQESGDRDVSGSGQRVLKESRSHDRESMMTRLTISGIIGASGR